MSILETSEFWIQVKNEYIKSREESTIRSYHLCNCSDSFKSLWSSKTDREKIRDLFNEFYILLGEPEEIIIPINNQSTSALFYVDCRLLSIEDESPHFREFVISQRLQFIDWCIKRFSS
jgi:hypothetical protein